MKKINLTITAELCAVLGIVDSASDEAVATAVLGAAKKAQQVDAIQAKLDKATTEKVAAETELADIKAKASLATITAMLDTALEQKKITVEVKNQFAKDYASNPDGLQTVLKGMGVYSSVVGQIEANEAKLGKKYEGKSWDELFESNQLEAMRKEVPGMYRELFKEEHGQYPS